MARSQHQAKNFQSVLRNSGRGETRRASAAAPGGAKAKRRGVDDGNSSAAAPSHSLSSSPFRSRKGAAAAGSTAMGAIRLD